MNKTTPKPKPMTAEERQQQVVRFLAQKRESYFQLILANLCQNPNAVRETKVTVKVADGTARTQLNIIDIVDAALEGSDYLMQKMYEAKED